MKKMFTAVAAALLCSQSVFANLSGTPMNLSVTHDGAIGALSNITITYTYGNSSTFTKPGWGDLAVSSPAIAPGFNNAMLLDFTSFSYSAFTGPFATTGHVTITGLAEAPVIGSVQLLVNGSNIALGPATNVPTNGFTAAWNSQSVFDGNPVAPSVVVAWNSAVPAPGALALLGIAGLTPRRRRRS